MTIPNLWEEDSEWGNFDGAPSLPLNDEKNSFDEPIQFLEEEPVEEVQDHEIFSAIMNGDVRKVVNLLIGDPDCVEEVRAEDSFTPLGAALVEAQLEIFRILLEHGANIYNPVGEYSTIIHLAMHKSPAFLNTLLGFTKDPYYRTRKLGFPLFHLAISQADTNIVEIVIKNSFIEEESIIDINAKDNLKRNALFLIVECGYFSYLPLVLQYFKDQISEESLIGSHGNIFQVMFNGFSIERLRWVPKPSYIHTFVEHFYWLLNDTSKYPQTALDILYKKRDICAVISIPYIDEDIQNTISLLINLGAKTKDEIDAFFIKRGVSSRD